MLALNENIRRLRRAAGLSQEELAGRLGVSRQSVSLWEQGETNPTVENIYAMTEVLGVSFDELMAEPADPKPTPDGEAVTARSYDLLAGEHGCDTDEVYDIYRDNNERSDNQSLRECLFCIVELCVDAGCDYPALISKGKGNDRTEESTG